MHPNPIFHTESEERNTEFARNRGFGILAVNGPDAPLLAHIPFLVAHDGSSIDLHLVRSNPIARALRNAPMNARLAVSGPDGYVSPDWYETPDQVPTWNYVAVHFKGMLRLLPNGALRDLIDRESAFFEERLRPKSPWTSDKMTPEVMEKMMRQIVPCQLRIDSVNGTWKLNQNKPDDVRMRAADAMEQFGIGQETRALAAMMRDA